MRTSLLLLFVLCYGANANGIKWEECDVTALCRAHHSCINPDSEIDPKLREFPATPPTQCAVGIHIKPDSTRKWTISIVNEKQDTTPERVQWTIGKNGEELFTFLGDSITSEIPNVRVEGKSCSTSYACWVFTVEVQPNSQETLSKILDAIRNAGIERTSYLSGSEYEFELEFYQVNYKIPCATNELFSEDSPCDESEQCDEHVKRTYATYSCPETYTLLLRKGENGNFIKLASIACVGGVFKDDAGVIETGSQAKCARKMCSLCGKKQEFENFFNKSDGFDQCNYLKCPEKQFMVINGELTIRPSQTVQCSAKTSVGSDSKVKPKWVVGENDEVEINTVECKDSVECDKIHPIVTDCEKPDDKSCVPPDPHPELVYVCKPGHTMRVLQNNSLGAINPPECDEKNAAWIIKSNNTALPEWRPEGNITINCFKDNVVDKLVTGDSSSNWTWLIILIVVILLIIIAIAIGAYCYVDRKKKKQKEAVGSAPTTKTSTTSKTSSKPSSDEKEPLTSAMKSVTADSIQTAIEQKPTVALTNTDLRPTTAAAAASDPPTDKKEEKKSETAPSKKDDKQSEKRKQRDPKDPSSSNWNSTNEDTSRNTRDVTSTKEKFAPMPKSSEDPLKSQTGGESQVEKVKNEESAKLLPKKGPPRKYKTSKSSGSSAGAKPKPNNDFLNVTSDEDEEPSKTGSKKRGRKRQ